MVSKMFPVAPRAGRQLFQQIPQSQLRAFSAGPQRYSDALAVVRIEVESQENHNSIWTIPLAI